MMDLQCRLPSCPIYRTGLRGACASRFKVLKNSGDAPPQPDKKEEVTAAVVEEEVKEKDEWLVVDDEAKHQSMGQMLIHENEGDKGLVTNDCKASAELEQEDAEPRGNETFKSLEDAEEAEKTEGKPIQISNLGTLEKVKDKPVAELVKAVQFGKKTRCKENPGEQVRTDLLKNKRW